MQSENVVLSGRVILDLVCGDKSDLFSVCPRQRKVGVSRLPVDLDFPW
jgi:hypothetical protein